MDNIKKYGLIVGAAFVVGVVVGVLIIMI